VISVTPQHALRLGAAVLLGLALLLALRPGLVDRPAPPPAGPAEIVIEGRRLPKPGTVIDLHPLPLALVRAADGTLTALSLRCPYLGCRLTWDPGNMRFSCPCHGDHFAADGAWIAGASPSHLHRHPLEEVDGGGVKVDLSGTFLMIGREIAPHVQYPTSTIGLHM